MCIVYIRELNCIYCESMSCFCNRCSITTGYIRYKLSRSLLKISIAYLGVDKSRLLTFPLYFFTILKLENLR